MKNNSKSNFLQVVVAAVAIITKNDVINYFHKVFVNKWNYLLVEVHVVIMANKLFVFFNNKKMRWNESNLLFQTWVAFVFFVGISISNICSCYYKSIIFLK